MFSIYLQFLLFYKFVWISCDLTLRQDVRGHSFLAAGLAPGRSGGGGLLLERERAIWCLERLCGIGKPGAEEDII